MIECLNDKPLCKVNNENLKKIIFLYGEQSVNVNFTIKMKS